MDIAKKNNRTLFLPKNSEKIHVLIILIVDYLLIPSVSMFIGQGLSLEARHAAQAERRAADTAAAAASEAAAVVANSMATAGGSGRGDSGGG